MSQEQDFKPRTIRLVGPQQVETAIAAISNAPLEQDLECVIRPVQQTRRLSQNALMWAGTIKDIAEQAWVGGRQFSEEVWHEHFKKEFLPEETDPELDVLVKDPEAWKKWDYTPAGERFCVGSTTKLTKKGFAQYLEQVMAFGASLGVQFSTVQRDYR